MTMSLLFSMAAHAQQDVTRFLGIPVDGSKSEMIHRLKEKGFQYNQSTGALRGEFNGLEVDIYVVTTKNKVSRIMVADVMGRVFRCTKEYSRSSTVRCDNATS